MYLLGRVSKRHLGYGVLAIIIIVTIVLLLSLYWFISHKVKNEGRITNNNQPISTKVSETSSAAFKVDEPLFTMTLPGSWKLIGRNVDGSYTSIQWQYTDKSSAGRWLRTYIDTIPKNFGVNYLLPVNTKNGRLYMGQQSDNCVNFTKGATPGSTVDKSTPISQETLPSRWALVDFICQNSRVSHRLVGTGSKGGINTVQVTGPTAGRHSYFFVYNDDNFHPDFSIFRNILTSFRAK